MRTSKTLFMWSVFMSSLTFIEIFFLTEKQNMKIICIRHLICIFCRPLHYNTGKKYATFLNVDLKLSCLVS